MSPPARRSEHLAVAAALVTVALWASAFVGIRAAGRDLGAGPLTLGRLLAAAATLGVLVAARREALPPRRDAVRLVVCGLLWLGAYSLLLNAAEQRVDAGTAAMLVNVGPLLIALLAGLLLGEGFPQRLLIGSLVAFAGVVLIGVSTSTSSSTDAGGVLLCLGAAAAYAVAVIAQ